MVRMIPVKEGSEVRYINAEQVTMVRARGLNATEIWVVGSAPFIVDESVVIVVEWITGERVKDWKA